MNWVKKLSKKLQIAMKNAVFWDVDSCEFIRNRRFRGTYLFRLQKLRSLTPQANYTDRATAACRRS
jgi:hypothetical protein